MTVVKDGSGAGYLAKVGPENDLHTRAITLTEISAASASGSSFQAEGETTITALTEKTVIVLTNDGDTDLNIGSLFISTKNETGKLTTVKVYLGNVARSAAGSLTSAVNLNTGSLDVPDVTIYEDNPTVTGTDVMIIELYFQAGDGSNFTVTFDGGIVLKRNGSLRITCKGDTLAAGTYTCDASFQFWKKMDI